MPHFSCRCWQWLWDDGLDSVVLGGKVLGSSLASTKAFASQIMGSYLTSLCHSFHILFVLRLNSDGLLMFDKFCV